MKENNFRTANICNFRNLGAHHSDKDDGRAFLKINRSLERNDLGGIVQIIGANNSGKSNVLTALERSYSQSYADDDYTDFTYSHVKPHVSINVANGRYIVNESAAPIGFGRRHDEGECFNHLFREIALEYPSYLLYCSNCGKIDYEAYKQKVVDITDRIKNGTDIGTEDLFAIILRGRRDIQDGMWTTSSKN